jgi:thiamine pyrophosphate-dependent acetolactate synthase large subunit-like protein
MDFVAIAEGFGVPARRVSNSRDVGTHLRSAQSSGGPFLLEIPVSS